MLLGSESPEKKRLSPGGGCSTSAIYVGGLKDTEALFQQVGLQADWFSGQLYARQPATRTVPVMGSDLLCSQVCHEESLLLGGACLLVSDHS